MTIEGGVGVEVYATYFRPYETVTNLRGLSFELILLEERNGRMPAGSEVILHWCNADLRCTRRG